MTRAEQHPVQAILLMIAAVFCMSVMDVAFKLLVEHYPSMQVVFFRSATSLPLFVGWILLTGRRQFRTAYPGGHLLRGALGIVMLFAIGECFREMQLADVYALFFAAPLLITILSGPVLGEPAGPVRVTAAVIGFAAPQFNNFINTWFASSCEPGSMSWLQYAYRVLWFPIGLVGSSLAIAAMPVMSRHAASGDTGSLRQAYTSATVMSFVLSIPAMFGIIFLARPIIQMLFERGQFSALDTEKTALVLSIYAISLFAFSALKISIPIFYALNKTRFPVIGAFLTVALNLIIIFATIDQLQYCAIALSFALFTTFNFLFLAVILYRLLQGCLE